MDIKTVFLNEDLEEEIYMEQLKGFIAPGNDNKVCRFIKSLYGLKQVSKQWHEKFDQVLLNDGFKTNESDECVYFKFIGSSCIIICLYVDDLLIFGTNLNSYVLSLT